MVRRLNFFDPKLSSLVFSHCITNESWVEHSFGFTTKKEQGQLQSVEEYVQSKRRNAVDFQIRMCNAPFIQYVKSKVRDKGYQQLDEHRKVDISYKELCEIFKTSSKDKVAEVALSDEESSMLKKSILAFQNCAATKQSNKMGGSIRLSTKHADGKVFYWHVIERRPGVLS